MAALFSIDAKFECIEAVDRALQALDPLSSAQLLEGLARTIQEQTRHRIIGTKRAPNGKAWPANRTGTSVLHKSGTLARSIDYLVSGESAVIGSGLIYARIHQQGGTIRAKNKKALQFRVGNRFVTRKSVRIPPRPYLGLSAENAEDILDQTARFLRVKLGVG